LSLAFAAKSKGTAHVILPADMPIDEIDEEDNDPPIWPTVKYPALTNNAQIRQIVRVDPDINKPMDPPAWRQGDKALPEVSV
jgi:hypothetical protein